VLTAAANFDHKTRCWLVLWEADLVIEMPPWTLILYPSSLFTHFNVDVHGKLHCLFALDMIDWLTDLGLVCTDHGQPPTPTNCWQVVPGDPCGRGSIVFYNQAAMFHGPETGFDTLGEARKHGGSGTRNFSADIRAAFATAGIRYSLDANQKGPEV
jgi:hypothetical protein